MNNYVYKIDELLLIIHVYNRKTNKTLLSSARGPLIASDNYFEWSLHLGSDILLGLGEYLLDKKPLKKLLLLNEHDNYVPYILAYGTCSIFYLFIKLLKLFF